jgi:hypothetical protein
LFFGLIEYKNSCPLANGLCLFILEAAKALNDLFDTETVALISSIAGATGEVKEHCHTLAGRGVLPVGKIDRIHLNLEEGLIEQFW